MPFICYMKSKLFILIIYIFVFSMHTNAQSFTLQGRVTDEKMNPIEFATVQISGQGGTMTNLNGEFNLQLSSQDSVVVRFSMIGYITKKRVLTRPKGKQTLQVVLYQNDTELAEVTVTGTKAQTGQMQELKPTTTKTSPSTTGNAVEELIQSQAGVSTHSELSSQYNVRGGSFDENSVYINNIEVYRPFLVKSDQQEGLSIINSDMVDKVGFSTGGFEAKYGDKMSSALDITYKRPKESEASVSASLLGGSAYLGLSGKKITWLNGIRYKTTQYLLGSLDTKGEYKPNFLDYQTYLSYAPNKNWQIDFIGDISDNQYNFTPQNRDTKFGTMQDVKSFLVYFDGQEKDLFRTYFGALSIKRNISPSTYITLLASAFHTKEQQTYDIQGQYWLTQTETSENLGVGTYFQHARDYLSATVGSVKLLMHHQSKKHTLEGAITFKEEHISNQTNQYEMRDSSGYSIPHTGEDLNMIYTLKANNTLNSTRFEAYLQDSYRFNNASENTFYTLNYGIRINHWSFNKETTISPRLSLGIIPAFNNNVTLRFATGIYNQAPFFKETIDTTTVAGITYAQLNNKIKSQRSIHFIAGFDYKFNMVNRPFKFTAEGYYKLLSNIIPYSVNNMNVVYYGNNDANGYAAGLDVKLFGEFVPGSDSWISLSLMNTQMNLNGKKIPLPTDQRYSINMFFTDFFPGTQRWKMSLKLAFADGLPFFAPHRELETNTFRAPAYQRVDIGMSYRLLNNEDKSRKSIFKNIWLGVDCLNILGINNVNSYYWITDVTNQQYAVPNYLTNRMINAKVLFEF